jgi:hypothetical protein
VRPLSACGRGNVSLSLPFRELEAHPAVYRQSRCAVAEFRLAMLVEQVLAADACCQAGLDTVSATILAVTLTFILPDSSASTPKATVFSGTRTRA